MKIEDFAANFRYTGGHISCPLHSDTSPSLKIYEKTQSFYCFSCGIHGDINKLAEIFGIKETFPTDKNIKKDIKIPQELTFIYDLLGCLSKQSYDYLYSRGFTDKTISKFKLFSIETYIEYGDYKFTPDRIYIPYFYNGKCFGCNGRDITGKHKKKYHCVGDVSVFNSDVMYTSKSVYVTEGEFDCMILEQNLRKSVCVNIGRRNRLYKYLNEHELLIAFDRDEPGEKAYKSLENELKNSGCKVKRFDSFGEKDINESFLAENLF